MESTNGDRKILKQAKWGAVSVGAGHPCRAYRYVRAGVAGDSSVRHVRVESELSYL
jgi:hypothetical protein